MALTDDQIKIIKSTVPVLKQHGQDITSRFYRSMLADHTELNNIFNHSNQLNEHQSQALAGAVLAYATYIDNLAVLGTAIEKICQKHVSLYIRPEQYAIVGEHLLGAMGHVLGAALTEQVLEAWTAAYWQLANLMIQTEAALLQKTDGWTDWRDFTIADKVRETDEITSFYLKPVDGRPLPSFLPGQYISVMTDVPTLKHDQTRQYSLSEAPRPDYYRISVRKELGLNPRQPNAEAHPGYVSNVLHDEKEVGQVVKVSHPAGEFHIDASPNSNDNGPIVMISAGVGITPMISILDALVERDTRRQIVFIHGARSTTHQAFGRHVRNLASKHANIKAVFFLKSPRPDSDVEGVDYHHASRVRLDVLDKTTDLFLDQPSTRYFLCGPGTFPTDMHAALVDLGVDEASISMDKFSVGGFST